MPKRLRARPPLDTMEEQQIRKLAGSRRAPAEQVARARTIARSWDGASTATIAIELACHPQTIRDRIARFNEHGLQSVTARTSGGRKPRLTELERQELVAVVLGSATADPEQAPSSTAAGRPLRRSSWTLDALVVVAHDRGIDVKRSQLRRILQAVGIYWDPIRGWAVGKLPELPPSLPRSGMLSVATGSADAD